MAHTKKTKFPHVHRIVYPKSHLDGYIVNIFRKSGRLMQTFQLADYDYDHDKCQAAAAKAAAAFDKAHPRQTYLQFVQSPRPKKDRDLPTGLYRDVQLVRGKKYTCIVVSWTPKPGGRQKRRYFAVSKYGEKKAIALALAQRKAALAKIGDR